MYNIKLADGTMIENLELNGNNYIPKIEIDIGVFEDSLSKVTIVDPEGKIEELENIRVTFAKVGTKQSFILAEKSKEEVEKERISQILADLTELVLMGGM